ncbi:peptide chain release factor N(5)-glutamine methyltransferase [Chlorobium ferrooxidans]|uniref:Release factor glutamine methyltransferase n=1 Tax=Chlorobium ferrooxidans DSM 13031 TaxID=377431 RepID=Q0YS77_9CHLB|nr:peptide chain release factor N(5)-glutamine methyltransferase [Chlorobium ferrooxidans]EAT59113.1 modification methylase, HemK family [Chlorobium ferrooxidans DSM 13031]
MEEYKEWQVVELLRRTAGFFTEKNVDEPRLSAELLLGSVIGKSRLELYLQYSRPVYQDELDRFRALCRQRLEGRPVQYILGEQCFYGLEYSVDERVLIPRPETELLVEQALESLGYSSRGGPGEANILDIGTGSGCIAVTMAKLCPALTATAVDCSLDALAVARRNAGRHGVESRISFVTADMLDDHFSEKISTGPFTLILSNPPYIPEGEWDSLQKEVRDYEPKLALTTPNGFECYRSVAGQAAKLLTAGGKLFFELHADGAVLVSEIMKSHGFSALTVTKDYSGLDRVISGRLVD